MMEPIISRVGVIDKAMLIISSVEDEPRSLADLVAMTGQSKATAHRLASALELHGMLSRLDDGRYSLGFRLVGLGGKASEGFPLAERAPRVLVPLRDETGESTQLYVRDGEERVCVAAVESTHGLRTMVGVGSRLTMEQGSAARALVGDVLAGGYAESVGEREPGVASVSAPVLDGAATVRAAVSVSGPIGRLGENPGDRFGAAVLEAAESMAAEMGWRA